MTEAEWLDAISPGRMLWHLEKTCGERKRNLFSVACLRRIWHLLPGPKCRHAVEVLERYVEGQADSRELDQAREDARAEGYAVDTGGNRRPSTFAALAASDDHPEYIADNAAEATAWVKVGTPEAVSKPEEIAQAHLCRELFGNPFRPIAFDPAWRTSTALAVAEGIYADRAFDRLPILADALQDAGCEDADILGHLRGDGPHVRGCWALDLVLGKN